MGKLEEAAFAAGCFWGVEDAFMRIRGVKETEVGFMGGHTKNATYEEVCRGDTGHAETVHLKYDPEEVSYGELLEAFWGMHDPTTKNRQGPDSGSQYRSIIFYYTEKQREEAEKSRNERQKKLGGRKIVTEILPAGEFWRAEEHHQKYHQKMGGSCRV
jgi:peptide-methionine (S)-S-oxide reductase